MPENKIKIYGELVAQTEEGIVANTSSIYSVPDSKYLNEVLEGLEDKTDTYIIEATVDPENATDEYTFPLVFTTTAAELVATLSSGVTYALKLVDDDSIAGIFPLTMFLGDAYTFIGTMKMSLGDNIPMTQTIDIKINLNTETEPATLSGSLTMSMNYSEDGNNAGYLTYSENDGYVLENVTKEDFYALSSALSYGKFKGFAIYYDGRIYNFESLDTSSFTYVFSAFEAIDNSSFYKYVLAITWTTDGNDQSTFTVDKHTYTVGGNVEANPQDAATAPLSKLKVNGTTYSITDTQPIYYNINGTIIYDANTDIFSLTVSNNTQELYEKLAAVYLDKTLQVQGNFNLAIIASGESTPSVMDNYCLTLKMNNIYKNDVDTYTDYSISFETTSLGSHEARLITLRFDFWYVLSIAVRYSSSSHEYNISSDMSAYGITNTITDTPLTTAFRPITSGAVYNALQNKQDKITSSSLDDQTIVKAIGFTAGGVLAKGVASPTNYLVSASVSGDTLTINPNSGNAITFTPSGSELPTMPVNNGRYHLICTVVNGTPTLTWELEPDTMSYTEEVIPSGYEVELYGYDGCAETVYVQINDDPTWYYAQMENDGLGFYAYKSNIPNVYDKSSGNSIGIPNVSKIKIGTGGDPTQYNGPQYVAGSSTGDFTNLTFTSTGSSYPDPAYATSEITMTQDSKIYFHGDD